MGLDAETGVFMLLFLDLAHDEAQAAGRLRTRGDLVEAIVHGAVKRVRPKAMTVAAAFIGLLPIMWSTGTGADLMKRIAAPMVGGLVTSFILELLVYPAVYFLWKGRGLVDGPATAADAQNRGTVDCPGLRLESGSPVGQCVPSMLRGRSNPTREGLRDAIQEAVPGAGAGRRSGDRRRRMRTGERPGEGEEAAGRRRGQLLESGGGVKGW